MKHTSVLFPIDLYHDTSYIQGTKVFLVEEPLYFDRSARRLGSMRFNILKPVYHRATMRRYMDMLGSRGISCEYIGLATNWVERVKQYIGKHNSLPVFFDPVDRYVEQKISRHFKEYHIINTPRFICTVEDLAEYKGATRQTSFYKWLRARTGILMRGSKPHGGKLTYDTMNREPPYHGIRGDLGVEPTYTADVYVSEAFRYVRDNIPAHHMRVWERVDEIRLKFPITRRDAIRRLKWFVANALDRFGTYEDVFLKPDGLKPDGKPDNSFVFHAAISPMLNIGLIVPSEVIGYVCEYLESHPSMIANVEGFVRQILGWREFARYTYETQSHVYLGKNFFNASNMLGTAWHTASTGMPMTDHCIGKAWRYGYLHHIERLMVCANHMVLGRIDPTQMYRWFMEFALDSYDWVMEYNCYSMASYSDGGNLSSKPYISGSRYLARMSDYAKDGIWDVRWDRMFWQFIASHRKKIKKIPRLAMLIRYAVKYIGGLQK